MNNTNKKKIFAFTGIGLLLFSVLAYAVEVILVPAYISGAIGLNGVTTKQASIYASGGGYSSSTTSTAGSYTLTVNTPENGSLDYNVTAQIYTDNYRDRLLFKRQTVTASAGQTIPLNFSINPCIITGTVSISDGAGTSTVRSGSLNALLDSNGNYTNARTSFGSDGAFSFPVQPNSEIRVYGNTSDNNGRSFSLENKYVSCAAGETVNVSWALTVVPPPQTGTITGSIGVNGVSSIDRLYVSGGGRSANYTNNNVTYTLQDARIGTQRLSSYGYMNNYDDYFRFPNASYIGGQSVDVPAGGSVTKDIITQASLVNGIIGLGGSKGWDDVAQAQISSFGVYYSQLPAGGPSYGGNSRDNINTATGQYDLVLAEGDWRYNQMYLRFYNTSADDYLNSNIRVTDYTRSTPVTLASGEVLNNQNFSYKNGTVTINFSIKDGGTLSSPRVSANCRSYDENGQLEYVANGSAFGPNGETSLGKVTFVGIPSDCTFTAYAYVGGSSVEFGEVELTVLPGTDINVDIGGPSLNITSPEAELYTTDNVVTVSGTATDDNAIDSITVNGVAVTLTSTNNPDDPNEVMFTYAVSLNGGPNSIETVATDGSGKTASDTRTVYQDAGPPTLNWSPADGAVVATDTVTVEGIADDDNTITKVTVNGNSVAFSATGNGNEVEFSTTVSLLEGANQILVTTSDNSERTTSQTHTVTYSLVTNEPPVANAGLDQIVEARGLTTSVILNGSGSSDPDGNSLSYLWVGDFGTITGVNPNVNLGLGIYAITLTVDDGSGATSSDEVNITVQDTTPPVITVPTDVTVEASGPNSVVDFGTATAEDLLGVNSISSDAPTTGFPLGTTVVTWTATDAAGNSATATQTVTVVDTTAPVVAAPANVSIEATGINTAYTLTTATATDAVGVVSLTSNAPASFPLGTTVVTWTATDAAGNSATATQTVTVVDTTAPVVDVPADLSIVATGETTSVDIGDATATDAVGVVSLTSNAPASFPLGTTVVTWTATDAAGNSGTATQSVTVHYQNSGFLVPLREGGRYKQGRVIPVKFQLSYENGSTITSALANISVLPVSNGVIVGGPVVVSSVSKANTGTFFRSAGSQYIYNLDTKAIPKGTYRIIATISDGSIITRDVVLK